MALLLSNGPGSTTHALPFATLVVYAIVQGLLESCWGGTPIEAWSSKDAQAACAGEVALSSQPEGAVSSAGGLWNGMIVPLLPLPIKGAIW